jgi:Cu2+-exporting ATPase
VDHYIAETLPERKAEVIEHLQRDGKTVCFVGDGINDAIALKQANVSISLRGAAGVATETAQVILLDQNLQQVGQLFDLAAGLKANMRNNVVITIISGALTVGAVYVWHVGVAGSQLINNLGLTSGLINATLPLLRHRDERS